MLFHELAPAVQTGDVFLFHGTALESDLIERATGSRFSHVGVAVRLPGLPDNQALHLFHAATKKVMLMPLYVALKDYPEAQSWGTFVCRHLSVDRTPALLDEMHRFIESTLGTPFPTILGMAKHWAEGQLGIDSGESTYFCAQLAADAYRHMGLLPTFPPPNHYSPKDFSYEFHHLALMQNATLGDEIVVELDGAQEVSAAGGPSSTATKPSVSLSSKAAR